MSQTDRIEKQVLLHAPRSRVWQALTDAAQFSSWFGVRLSGSFVAGQPVTGRLTFAGYEHVTFEVTVERLEPEEFFSFRWHPYALDQNVDYSAEPTTLVAFRLEVVPDGTRLTVIESGFDRIPAGRRAEAFRMNDKGWAQQLQNIERYVAN